MNNYMVFVTVDGVTVQHWHPTREAARNHVRKVNNNIFLKGWSAKGCSVTGERL